ncbi:heme exporter protein CcmB [Sediminitomix flava]|uniref:Heme exporter protein B n=1 Tax=Sediminitomix flava TaxID=379075 RepID=A0A315ZD37_SEDFL|nr:heme exporter protein CcmB [Sediminitomix flava]PWJ42614.1 heme exporter protein B [Sediminitomix flava]
MNHLLKEVRVLVQKEMTLEWRDRSSLNGILLYTFSTVFVCYLSFNQQKVHLHQITWNTLFWIIQLFTVTNAIAKCFDQEKGGRYFFYYSLVSPQALILSKIIYNAFLSSIIALVGFVLYSFVMDNPVQDLTLFSFVLLLGAIGFSTSLTLIAGIASKASNSSSLMAVLGFPVILPMILLLVKASKNAIDGLAWSASQDEVVTLIGVDFIVVAISILLFPYLWRS